MPFRIIRNDITKVTADAIVNTASPLPLIGRGTDSALYKAAGRDQILAERARIGEISPGEAAYTPAFNLDAKYIIHTVGPVWRGGDHGELEILGSCYRKSLLLANYLGCRSIAFPMISSGSYGMPKDKALKVALDEISDFLMVSEMDVTLVVFDKESFKLSAGLLDDVKQYIDDNYVEEKSYEEYPKMSGMFRTGRLYEAEAFEAAESEAADEDDLEPLVSASRDEDLEDVDLDAEEEFDAFFHQLYEESKAPAKGSMPSANYSYRAPASLDEAMMSLGKTFQQKLLELIDEKGYTDTQVYKRANIDRKLFSKIRCNENYKPSKATVLALAISLELNLDETVDLLRRAGLALQPSSKSDLIVQYCIARHIYDIFEVNSLLFEYDQQLLGA